MHYEVQLYDIDIDRLKQMKNKAENEEPYDLQALELAKERDDEIELVMGEDGVVREIVYI